MGLKLSDVQCLSKLKFVLSQVCRVLANMTPTCVFKEGLCENSCMHPGKTTLALWSSMLIFFKRNAMSVRSKRHPVYKSSTEGEGRGRKSLSSQRQRDTLPLPSLSPPTDHHQAWNFRLPDWNLGTCGVSGFYLNHKDCGCMLWILYDLTNTTVLRIGEINRSWNGPAGIFVHLGLGCCSLAKTLSVPRPINQAEQFLRIFPFQRTTLFCK